MFEEFLNKLKKLLVDDIRNFKTTVDASPEMMCLMENEQTVYVNSSWSIFTGRTLEKELGEGRFDIIHPDCYQRIYDSIKTSFKNQISYRIKYRLLDRNGNYQWVVENAIPNFSPTNVLLGYVCKCVNINEEVELEKKLQTAEIKYRRLFEAAHNGVLILDSLTGEITNVNPFLVELLGYTKEEFLGKKLWEVGAFKNIQASKETFITVKEVGYARYDDLPLETKDGVLIPVEFVSNIYKEGDTSVIQCNIRDIRERKKIDAIEKKLAILKEEEQKNIFIADVTHELRTPLAIIKGNVELALKHASNPDKETFNLINHEVNHLSKILMDLVILTTNNKPSHENIVTTKINLTDSLMHVVGRLQIIGLQKNIKITVQDLPSINILGDKEYLEKLFFNIISNAIYYGKNEGTIQISYKFNNEQVELRIKDNGIGISKEELPNIFGRFYRSVQAREINQEGTGLGLAISKWIVDAHQGTISVDSAIGKGTTFRISFPVIV